MTAPMVTLSCGRERAIFDLDDGFRLTSLTMGNRELVAPDAGLGTFWWGSFVMAPWTSNLTGGRFNFLGKEYSVPVDQEGAAIHGIARKQRWAWDGKVASCSLSSDWPFGGRVLVEPELRSGVLAMKMTLLAGDVRMPGAIGWHPWFVRRLDGVAGNVVLPSGTLLQHRDEGGVATGLWQSLSGAALNDGLRVSGPVHVAWPGVGRIRVVSDGGYMIVFDDNDHGVCVEPMTSPAGNMDRLLLPREAMTLRFTVEWMQD